MPQMMPYVCAGKSLQHLRLCYFTRALGLMTEGHIFDREGGLHVHVHPIVLCGSREYQCCTTEGVGNFAGGMVSLI